MERPLSYENTPMSASKVLTRDSQVAILDDPRRFCLVAAGRRWGKTTFGVCKLHNSALMGTATYLHISPSIAMAELAYKCFVEVSGGWRHVKSSRTVQAPNGSCVVFVGEQEACNVDRWRGHIISGIVVDEPWMCTERLIEPVCFHVMFSRVWVLLAGTPPPLGRRKWLGRPRLAARLAAIRLGFDPLDVAVYLCSTQSGSNVSQASLRDWRASTHPDQFDAETLSDYA